MNCTCTSKYRRMFCCKMQNVESIKITTRKLWSRTNKVEVMLCLLKTIDNLMRDLQKTYLKSKSWWFLGHSTGCMDKNYWKLKMSRSDWFQAKILNFPRFISDFKNVFYVTVIFYFRPSINFLIYCILYWNIFQFWNNFLKFLHLSDFNNFLWIFLLAFYKFVYYFSISIRIY